MTGWLIALFASLALATTDLESPALRIMRYALVAIAVALAIGWGITSRSHRKR